MFKKILGKPEGKESDYERLQREGRIAKPYVDGWPPHGMETFALSPDAKQSILDRRAERRSAWGRLRAALGITNEPKSREWYRRTAEARWEALDREIEDRRRGKFIFPESSGERYNPWGISGESDQ